MKLLPMRYIYILSLALAIYTGRYLFHSANDFYFDPPDAVMVNQLAVIRAHRSEIFVDGTIEMTLPETAFTGINADLANDPGPCTVNQGNVVCYPTKNEATLWVFAWAKPHTSPVRITGRATSAYKNITDTTYLTVGGVLRAYTPVLVR